MVLAIHVIVLEPKLILFIESVRWLSRRSDDRSSFGPLTGDSISWLSRNGTFSVVGGVHRREALTTVRHEYPQGR